MFARNFQLGSVLISSKRSPAVFFPVVLSFISTCQEVRFFFLPSPGVIARHLITAEIARASVTFTVELGHTGPILTKKDSTFLFFLSR